MEQDPGNPSQNEQGQPNVPLFDRPELVAAAQEDERLAEYLHGLRRAQELHGEMVDIYGSMERAVADYARERHYLPPEPTESE